MDFDFSNQQFMFQEATRSFLDANYNIEKLRKLQDGDGLDRGFWEQLTENGAFSMLVPEEHGGMGLTFVDLALVLEEYGRALAPAPVAETIVATDVFVRFATDDQKRRLLPPIAGGKLKIVPAITETETGGDPADISVTAVPSGEGWNVSGRKILVPCATTADLILLAVRFGPEGSLGLALIPSDRPGISSTEHKTLDPSTRFHELRLDSVAISRDDIVGGEPSAASVARLLDAGSVAAAIMMIGISSKVLDEAVEYVKQRTQFGKPIGSFQAIKHRCADMAVAIESSRSAAYYAAWALAEDAPDRPRAVSMAKSYCGDTSSFVCNEGIQLHGGIGFTWELGLHFYLRRAKVLEYSYGDATYHRERVLAETISELDIGGN